MLPKALLSNVSRMLAPSVCQASCAHRCRSVMTDKRTLNHLPRPAPVKKLRFGTISQDRDPWLRGHKALWRSYCWGFAKWIWCVPINLPFMFTTMDYDCCWPWSKKTSFCRVRFLQRLISSQSAENKWHLPWIIAQCSTLNKRKWHQGSGIMWKGEHKEWDLRDRGQSRMLRNSVLQPLPSWNQCGCTRLS